MYKLYAITLWITATTWFLSGIFVVCSLVYGTQSLAIHLCIGTLFVLFASAHAWKACCFKFLEQEIIIRANKGARILLPDMLITLCVGSAGVLVLCGVLYRIFGEQLPVFG